jgi:hypothetical protein
MCLVEHPIGVTLEDKPPQACLMNEVAVSES